MNWPQARCAGCLHVYWWLGQRCRARGDARLLHVQMHEAQVAFLVMANLVNVLLFNPEQFLATMKALAAGNPAMADLEGDAEIADFGDADNADGSDAELHPAQHRPAATAPAPATAQPRASPCPGCLRSSRLACGDRFVVLCAPGGGRVMPVPVAHGCMRSSATVCNTESAGTLPICASLWCMGLHLDLGLALDCCGWYVSCEPASVGHKAASDGKAHMSPHQAQSIVAAFEDILGGQQLTLTDSPKARLVLHLVQDAVSEGRKVLVFVSAPPPCYSRTIQPPGSLAPRFYVQLDITPAMSCMPAHQPTLTARLFHAVAVPCLQRT